MRMGNQVEWGLHCVAALAALGPGERLSASVLAELYEVPAKYLAKALQALSNADIVETTPGPKGGYRLAKPPAAIRLIDVVDAIEGKEPHFRCEDIRKRGPCATLEERHFARPCGIARAMWKADAAWRRELEAVTAADLQAGFTRDVPPAVVGQLQKWVQERVTR
jgi:Rrf2 family protein